jgi:hypothetical protein
VVAWLSVVRGSSAAFLILALWFKLILCTSVLFGFYTFKIIF